MPSALVFGHQIPPGLVDADLPRDRLGDPLVVAGNHDHARHAQGSQSIERRPGRRARRIHQTDDAQVTIALTHDHRRAAVSAQLFDRFGNRHGQGGELLGAEHLGLADHDALLIHRCRDAAASEARDLACDRQLRLRQSLFAVLDDRLRQRMIAEALDRHGDGKQLHLFDPRRGNDVRDARLTLGERAGLVERDRRQ